MHDHLDPLAQQLGRHMAEQCTDGLPGHFDDGVLEAFPGEDRKSIGLALAELEADGFIVANIAMLILSTADERR